jgi:hypothetical protein
MFGYIPSSALYGLVSKVGGDNAGYSFGFIVYSAIISAAFLFIALISKLNNRHKDNENNYNTGSSNIQNEQQLYYVD